jgi:hypothetical protein
MSPILRNLVSSISPVTRTNTITGSMTRRVKKNRSRGSFHRLPDIFSHVVSKINHTVGYLSMVGLLIKEVPSGGVHTRIPRLTRGMSGRRTLI